MEEDVPDGVSGKRSRLWVILLVILTPFVSFFVFIIVSVILWKVDLASGYCKTLASVEHEGYTVSYVQCATTDLYMSYLEITNPEGKIRRVMLEHDDFKIQGVRVLREGDREEFVGWRFWDDPSSVFVDHASGKVTGDYSVASFVLSEIDFDSEGDVWRIVRKSGSKK